MWLSKPLYETVPYYYIGLGLVSLTASLYVKSVCPESLSTVTARLISAA